MPLQPVNPIELRPRRNRARGNPQYQARHHTRAHDEQQCLSKQKLHQLSRTRSQRDANPQFSPAFGD